MNNFVPMNMIPFVANMKNVSDDNGNKPKPQPEPFNPYNILNKVVTLDFGEVEDMVWVGMNVKAFTSIDIEAFANLLIMCETTLNGIPSFKFRYQGKDYVIISYRLSSENSLDNLVDIDMNDASLTEHHTFSAISKEMDGETGDEIVILSLNQ